MIGVDLKFDLGSRLKLKRLARTMPNRFRRAFKAAVRHARNRFASVVRSGGGKYGVPALQPLSDFTAALRTRKGKLFGRFAQGKMIVKFPRGGGWIVGWPDRVTEWMSANQGESAHEFSKEQRHYFHKRLAAVGSKGTAIPPSYYRPRRLVAEPFGRAAGKWFPKMVIENFEKMGIKK